MPGNFYRTELGALYHGDCMEIMQSIPDESVDMILCDLPYGTTNHKWDVCLPLGAVDRKSVV